MARFPVYYRPRPYQAELHRMWGEHRMGVAVLPRQSGKDVAMSMEMCKRRLQTPKTTGVYISLNNPLIRDILWDKTYMDPGTGGFIRALQDNVPAELCEWKNTTMVGQFHNLSRLKLQGYFQSGQDNNGVGTSFQDYAFTELALFSREDPIPRLQPILSNEMEQKRLMVVSTPRGKRRNSLWQLMKSFEGSPDFKVIIRTIDDLNEMMRKAGLPPVRSEAQLEQDRDAYLRRFGNDRMFEQEYYCSFEEMDAAAVYGAAYMQMVTDKRVFLFNVNKSHPVYVVFDIGSSGKHSDATSWIAFQWINNQHWIVDCGEGHGKALPEYVDVLREKQWFPAVAAMILPWDGDHHEKAVNTTPADMMRTKFPQVFVLAKSNKAFKIPNSRQGDYSIITDIQQTRLALYNTYINGSLDDENPGGPCEWLLECIENYKFEFSVKEQQWSDTPLHDKYSHMMDALRYMVQATKELDFFGGHFYDDVGVGVGRNVSSDYEQDWSGVWRR